MRLNSLYVEELGDDVLSTLGWIKFAVSVFLDAMMFIFKVEKKMVPDYLMRMVNRNEIHNYFTRYRKEYYLDGRTIGSFGNSVFYNSKIEYN